jgi:hypothetical protein
MVRRGGGISLEVVDGMRDPMLLLHLKDENLAFWEKQEELVESPSAKLIVNNAYKAIRELYGALENMQKQNEQLFEDWSALSKKANNE